MFPFLSLQMTTALTASPLTKWPECTAIWTLYISNGVKAESPPPFPSHPWSSGRPPCPSLSTGCLQLVELCMTGERGTGIFLCGISCEQGEGREVGGTPVWNYKYAPLLRAASATLLSTHLLSRAHGALTSASGASYVPTPWRGASGCFLTSHLVGF